MSYVVTFQGTTAQAMELVAMIPAIFSGKAQAHANASRIMAARIGNTMLSNIKGDFQKKARGELGEDGTRWAPNAVITVKRKVERHLGNLKKKTPQSQAFQQRYARYLQIVGDAMAANKHLLNGLPKAAKAEMKAQIKAQAAAAAGYFAHEYREEQGFPGTLPFSLTQILRDRGPLLNSLTPGILQQPYTGPDADQQIFIADPGMITIGSRLRYAATHQFGDHSRHIPARPFLPAADAIPAVWWEDVYDIVWQTITEFLDGKLP
jgi:phage gpG-like protein